MTKSVMDNQQGHPSMVIYGRSHYWRSCGCHAAKHCHLYRRLSGPSDIIKKGVATLGQPLASNENENTENQRQEMS